MDNYVLPPARIIPCSLTDRLNGPARALLLILRALLFVVMAIPLLCIWLASR